MIKSRARTLLRWRSPRMAALLFCLIALATAIGISWIIATSPSQNALGRLSWLFFSVLPLTIVVLIAALGRSIRTMGMRDALAGSSYEERRK